MKATLPLEAQDLLDQANALFPNRYEATRDAHGRTSILDTHRHRPAGLHADPIKAAQKALTSARLSARNGNRVHTHGQEPHQLSLHVPHDAWTRLQQEAADHGLTVQEWALLKLTHQ
ncbi:hypothetical protein [Deinococcus sp. 12RED42]|uniref:hypothetical protein n=1 Tax=Deinococcus sp. 12RED42 TaxID=2745872 RepID=UPI001E48CEC4|nr:hypothetical protein [Deinococcus sp. 12RED42]MCD0166360.1 hypothetical protein [Deinococcus sp. 12RED42]